MMALVLTVCSLVHGATCKSVALTYFDEGQFATPYACLIGGMTEVAKWSEANPNWSVRRWRCDEAGRLANI